MKRAHDEIDGEPVAAAGSVKSEPESNGAPDVKGEPVEADGGGAGGAAAAAAMKREAAEQAHRRRCPYLDTINRHVLDFDFEKLCSVTLSNQNVYACLVCGKYFQGRGRSTHAYTHSVQHSHHVFIHLETSKIYCLPDNYEVVDSSLDDIKRALFPSYAPRDMAALDCNTTLARDQYGVAYLPGFVGLNNLTSTDYLNVTLHALAHVAPLRDFFLVPANYAGCKSPLVLAFGEVIRRLWSHDNFKSAVSPHEFLQAVSIASNKRFHVGQQAECIDFMSWLLNSLHVGLGGSKKKKAGTSIIHKTFQGLVHVHTMTRVKRRASTAANGASVNPEEGGGGGGRGGRRARGVGELGGGRAVPAPAA
eukprot:TRINITY_DN4868_c0_g1_i3.p1 TRINITY_DN4868_c0_g1~~TRINITY_DN4868_c0_g1_i3.p1  ORF type:complete len:383 (-),score=125.60 TRINITY_DN4868_c0_g1_i3:706-1794(-)